MQATAYYSQKETEEAAAAVLAMAFPSYSAAALRKVPCAPRRSLPGSPTPTPQLLPIATEWNAAMKSAVYEPIHSASLHVPMGGLPANLASMLDSVLQVLRKANGDIAAAAKELSQMEIEHSAQQKATAAARKPKAGVRPPPASHSTPYFVAILCAEFF